VSTRGWLRAALACLAMLSLSGVALAKDTPDVTIAGRIVHGAGDPAFDPTGVVVSLHVLEGVTSFDQISTKPDAGGGFTFTFPEAPGRTYFVTADYQGARYSDARRSASLAEPMLLTVYDATSSSDVLEFESYSVIVTGVLKQERFVEVFELATVRNDSGMTLVPNEQVDGPAMLNFLRFALPPGAYNLAVDSNLVGGQILKVDRGVALTTPIPPTLDEPHEFRLVYRLRYEGDSLDLSRTMRFGARSFNFVVPAETARPVAPALSDLGAADVRGRLTRLMEASDIGRGEFVELIVTGLPTPTLLERAATSAGTWYVRVLLPGLLGVLLLALVAAGLRRRGLAVTAGADRPTRRAELLRQAAFLETRRRAGTISERRHEAEREAVKQALIDLELEAEGTGEAT
jgi:hypothetical protein